MFKKIGKKFELWITWASWCHPGDWHFAISNECFSGCTIVECGFFGFTILINECTGDYKEENE